MKEVPNEHKVRDRRVRNILHFLSDNTIFQQVLHELQLNILYISKMDEQQAGMKSKCVFYTHDLEEGWNIVQKARPQIIIVHLPMEEAFLFISKIKMEPKRFIVICEEEDGAALTKLISLGVRFFAMPPVTTEHIIQFIQESIFELSLQAEVNKLKDMMRPVVEFQGDLIFFLKNDELIDCNTNFLQFIDYDYEYEYHELHDVLFNLFVQEPGYYYPKKRNQWIEDSTQCPRKIKMKNKQGLEKVFLVRASLLQDEASHYVVICTDMTRYDEYENENEQIIGIDALTNHYTRYKFEALLVNYWAYMAETNAICSIVLLDIDHLPEIYKKYGQDTGDLVIAQLGDLIALHVENKHMVARWDTGTFIIMFADLSWKEAFIRAEKLRFFIETKKFTNQIKITASCGVAMYEDGMAREQLLQRTTEALMEAKEKGSNQIIVYRKE